MIAIGYLACGLGAGVCNEGDLWREGTLAAVEALKKSGSFTSILYFSISCFNAACALSFCIFWIMVGFA